MRIVTEQQAHLSVAASQFYALCTGPVAEAGVTYCIISVLYSFVLVSDSLVLTVELDVLPAINCIGLVEELVGFLRPWRLLTL